MLPRRDDRGPCEPTTSKLAVSSSAAATSRSAGWPLSTSHRSRRSGVGVGQLPETLGHRVDLLVSGAGRCDVHEYHAPVEPRAEVTRDAHRAIRDG
jgi:hypothetical protein